MSTEHTRDIPTVTQDLVPKKYNVDHASEKCPTPYCRVTPAPHPSSSRPDACNQHRKSAAISIKSPPIDRSSFGGVLRFYATMGRKPNHRSHKIAGLPPVRCTTPHSGGGCQCLTQSRVPRGRGHVAVPSRACPGQAAPAPLPERRR